MTITFHPYHRPTDFDRVGDFLIRHYQSGNRDGNWIQPMWEYMHSHPFLDLSALDRIGVWEDAGEIVGVCTYESTLGEVFFEQHPAYPQLKHEMLDHAERQLWGTSKTGRRYMQVFVNDFDAEFEAMVEAHGFVRDPEDDRPMYQYIIPDPFPAIILKDGFHLKSLQDDNDLHKIDRVLWRGFNHPGDPPPDEIDDRRKMQSVPNFRLDLNIVVEAPDGNFAAYSGTWYESTNHICYVEPVATDPDYRRLGLGKAAVLEGIRRCGALGATVAFVGNDLPIYKSIGFTPVYTSHCWVKYQT